MEETTRDWKDFLTCPACGKAGISLRIDYTRRWTVHLIDSLPTIAEWDQEVEDHIMVCSNCGILRELTDAEFQELETCCFLSMEPRDPALCGSCSLWLTTCERYRKDGFQWECDDYVPK